MDEFMVEQWNKKIHPKSTVYHLGDVVINRKHLHLVKRLNGKKRLVRGNHDIFKDKDYYDAGFDSLYGVRVFVDKFILSHIPLHPDCITDRFKVNVHGHLHANRVRMPDGSIDPRYMSACVEHHNYTPVHFDEMEVLIQKQFEECGYQPPEGYFNGPGPS
jgi:calcineurin-like phosphoesterase family protein